MPPQIAGEAAEIGTALHDAMEWIFGDESRHPDDCMGKVFSGVKIEYEHLNDKLLPAYESIIDLIGEYSIKEWALEPFVELIPDTAGGSIDFLGVSDHGKTAVIADYKFGYHLVSPEDNAQLLFYALCADADPATNAMFKHVEKLVLAIIQPNAAGEDDMRVFETPIYTLDVFEDNTAKAIETAESGCTTPVTGPHCKFCPAEAICPAKTGLAVKAKRLPEIHVDTLAAYLPMAEELEEWVKAVKKLAHEQMELGVKVEGYKLVNKRAMRTWSNPEDALTKVKRMRGISFEDACDFKLKSPAQLEKVFKAKGVDFDKVADYIVSVSSGTTLAKASDKRPEAPSVEAFKEALKRLPE